MARYGFDFHSTLMKNPHMAKLAKTLADDGHKVVIITRNKKNQPHDEIESILKNDMGIDYYKIIYTTGDSESQTGQDKGHAANKSKISMYFENHPEVMAGFAGTSRIARCMVPDQDTLQPANPKKKRDCPCQWSTRNTGGCFHCPEFLSTPSQVAEHQALHHGELEDRACPCQRSTRSSGRCFHCTEYLDTPKLIAEHQSLHHGEAQW